MKTKLDYVYSILESLTDFNLTDDHKIDEEWVSDKIDDVRATLIKGLKNIHDDFYQLVCCIEIECEKPACDINGVSIPSGDVLWKAELPSLIPLEKGNNIKYFGPPNLKSNFTQVSPSAFQTLEAREFTSDKTFYMILNGIAYFKNLPTSGIKYVCLAGLLLNPETACNYELQNSNYPVPSGLKLEILVKQDILSTYNIKPDVKQDARDNTNENVQQQKQ